MIYKFTIDVEFLTNIPIKFGWSVNEVEYGTMSHIDHPSFTALREHLGHQGFIKIERGWWNGDIVTKEFELNGFRYNVGDRFSSAAAQGIQERRRSENDDIK